MKILFANNARVCSGCEDHLVDVALWLRDNGVEPVFLVRAGGMLGEVLTGHGIRVHPVFIQEKKVSLPLRIAKVIRQERPDVISINREHNIFPVSLGARLAAPFLHQRPKMVAVFHTPTGRWYPGLKRFDGIVATSEYTAASFFKANPGIEQLTRVIHYGIRLPAADPVAKEQRARPRRYFRDRGFPIIGMVGELWKNQEELVEAAAHMLRTFPELTVAFIGGYDPSPPLLAKIEATGKTDRFVLTGRIPRERIPDAFFDLDLSVSTHRNEGFGIVHIESLAGLTPVVAYNSGGLVEIIRDGGGVLVEGGPEEFARAVVDLLADDGKRFALGREGRRSVEERFSIDAMGRKHLAFYQEVVGKSSRS